MPANLSLRDAVAPMFLFACLLLGGSTQVAWPNMVLQLTAIVILAWAGIAAPRAHAGPPGRNLVWLCYSMLALILLQIVPLPPAIWSALPGREIVVRGYALLDQPLPWLPLSLAPYETITAALWLLPPLAIIAAILRMGSYRAAWLAIVLGITSLSGVLLGILQVTSGDAHMSPWYLYRITSHGSATGFFANSNHIATLLIVSVPFMVALLGATRPGQRFVQQDAGRYAILGGFLLVLTVGLALNQSTAGFGLGVSVVAASLLIRLPITGTWVRWGLLGVLLFGLAAVISVFVTPLESTIAAAAADQSFNTRATSFSNSWRALSDFFPIGSGSGSFNLIYPAYENPDVVDRCYVNHVHNDYIELVLETGLAGLLLILVFLLWWVGRAIAIWRAPIVDHFARAATIASAAMLIHSLVDFPLRTSAIAAVLAMTIALMAGPRRRERIAKVSSQGEIGARHLSIG